MLFFIKFVKVIIKEIMSELLSPPCSSLSESTWCGVESYWGKIGDGKTHHLVKYRVLPALLQGRHVYTNIDFGGALTLADGTTLLTEEERAGALLSQYLKKDVRQFFHIVTNDWFKANLVLNDMDGALLKFPRGSRMIIDEAQMLFPIDGYRAADPRFFKLLTYSRHFDLDFVFATQNTALLDKRIISTSNELIMIKNLWFLSTFFKNRYQESHHQNLYAEPHQKKQLGFDKDIFALYKSSGSVVKRQGRAVPIFMVLPLLGLVFVFAHFLYKGHKSTFLMGKGFGNGSEMPHTPLFSPLPVLPSSTTVSSSPGSLSSAQQAIEQLNLISNSSSLRDSVISSNAELSDEQLKSQKFHLSPPVSFKGHWVRDNEGTWVWKYYNRS